MIFVTGSTGFIGRHLVRALYRECYKIRCLVRDKSKAGHIRKSDMRAGDMRDLNSLIKATEGCNFAIHLAAPMGHNDYKTNYDVTVTGAKNLVAACKANNVKRIIFFSSVGTLIKESNYGRTKSMAEDIFLSSGLDVTILRGDWIYGEGDWGLSAIVKIAKHYPVFPIPGDGNYRKRPLYVTNAVQAIIKCLHKSQTIGKTYMLGGEMITYNQMLAILFNKLNIKLRKIYVPKSVLLASASLLEIFGKRLSKNTILGLTYDYNYDNSQTLKDLVHPINFDEGLTKTLDYYKNL